MEAHGYTTFCDDIREEVGGKSTLVGCYTGELVHQAEYPLTLPKLGLFAQLLVPPDKMPQVFELSVDFVPTGQTLINMSNDLAGLDVNALLTPKDPDDEDEERYIVLASKIILSPLVVSQDGKLRVRAMLDGQLVRLGSLKIRRVADITSPSQAQ